jgi:hypothetical protein
MRAVHPLQSSLYALLAFNTLWFLIVAPWTKGLDSLAWFTLLLLFALETANRPWLEKMHARGLVHLLRFGAAIAIVVSACGYVQQHEWLDALNMGLWILVVILLECELRFAQWVAGHRRLFTRSAFALYAMIAALIPLWALRGEWFDAFDAVLWLIAFVLIEMDALKLGAIGST